jgi:hypothetical protein
MRDRSPLRDFGLVLLLVADDVVTASPDDCRSRMVQVWLLEVFRSLVPALVQFMVPRRPDAE